MKLCKDCKYYEKAGFGKVLGLNYDKCAHPSVLWPVDGTPHLGCGQVRQDEVNSYSGYGPGPCGSEAVLFEPIRSKVIGNTYSDSPAVFDELEIERMKLFACGVAAMANTPETAAKRIGPDSRYYSNSYSDVCAAVDREMALRALLAAAPFPDRSQT